MHASMFGFGEGSQATHWLWVDCLPPTYSLVCLQARNEQCNDTQDQAVACR